jgi:uncharacterized membrane protein (UPF0127 family)
MKRTLIPLQILYVDKFGQIFQSVEMPVEPDPENPKAYFYSRKDALFALEVDSHRFRGIEGDYLCIDSRH